MIRGTKYESGRRLQVSEDLANGTIEELYECIRLARLLGHEDQVVALYAQVLLLQWTYVTDVRRYFTGRFLRIDHLWSGVPLGGRLIGPTRCETEHWQNGQGTPEADAYWKHRHNRCPTPWPTMKDVCALEVPWRGPTKGRPAIPGYCRACGIAVSPLDEGDRPPCIVCGGTDFEAAKAEVPADPDVVAPSWWLRSAWGLVPVSQRWDEECEGFTACLALHEGGWWTLGEVETHP